MLHLKDYSKSVSLVLVMCLATQMNIFSFSPATTAKNMVTSLGSSITTPRVACATFIYLWWSLNTKEKPKNRYKIEDWSSDVALLCSSYHPVAILKNSAYFFDKWVVGTPAKSSNEERENTLADGTIVRVEGKKKIGYAFGLMGLFQKYVLDQFEKLGKIGTEFDKVEKLVKLFDKLA